MLRFMIYTALLLSACSSPSVPKSQENVVGTDDDKGPNVNDLVKAKQENWLQGQIQNPGKAKVNKLIVFGDSLSDPGNLNRRSLGTFLPPRIFYKSRFSNGPIWTDYASSALGWSLENYAVGGAETRANSRQEALSIASFQEQISENKANLKQMNFASTLVAIWIGPNNYLQAGLKVQDANQNPLPQLLDEMVKDSISDIKEGIIDLRDYGFRQFVIGTMIELGGINRNPKDTIRPSDATLYAATAAHNAALREMIKDLQKSYEDIKITMFQSGDINQKTIDNPKAYGFNRLDTPCYIGSLQGKFYGEKHFCSDPSGYKFWEYLHPNSKMHCYLASQFLADVTAAGIIAGYDQAKAISRCQGL